MMMASGSGQGASVVCLVCVVLIGVVCCVASMLMKNTIGKIEGVLATARGKPYQVVASELHAIVPNAPIVVVRRGAGQTTDLSIITLVVDDAGTVVEAAPEGDTYAHGGVVAKLGDFSQVGQ